ncbi:RidA family protein [Vibrio bivalvicida]|nr:RidA family protein [Vibrio bivalvicida]
MMNKVWSPSNVPLPAANYHQCAVIPASSTKLHIAGQLGIDINGDVPESVEEQIVLTWSNLQGVLHANKMDIEDLVSVRIYLTDRNDLPLYRLAKERLPFDVGGLPTTLLFVEGLFDLRWKVEIEAEAAKSFDNKK